MCAIGALQPIGIQQDLTSEVPTWVNPLTVTLQKPVAKVPKQCDGAM